MPLFHLRRDSGCYESLWSVPRPQLHELWVEARDHSALSLLEMLPDRGLAIVGTRRPLARSEWFTQELVRGLRGSRLVVVSGLARGIDRVAHESALESGIPTIGVLGCGHDHTYPPESQPLREAILDSGGLIISEFAPGMHPARQHFVRRNRCIAAWSKATCVIEAPAKSGSLLTADYAMERHATLFSVPSFPGDRAFAGNQRLIDEHAAIPLWGAHSLGAAWLELATIQQALPLELAGTSYGRDLKNERGSL
jgi:DNA processing protein